MNVAAVSLKQHDARLWLAVMAQPKST